MATVRMIAPEEHFLALSFSGPRVYSGFAHLAMQDSVAAADEALRLVFGGGFDRFPPSEYIRLTNFGGFSAEQLPGLQSR
jgi:hypothetical protein